MAILLRDERGAPSPYERLRRHCHDRLATEVRLSDVPASQQANVVRAAILTYLFEQRANLPLAQREQIVTEILQDALGYGPITCLLGDDGVTEIMVNGFAQVYVERFGRIEAASVRFRDDAHVMQIIERIIAPLGRRVDEGSPMVDARLPDGSRVNAIIPPASRIGPTLTIRKFARKLLTPEDLIAFGAITPPIAELLRLCVQAKLSVLVSGGTGVGKTSLLNVLALWIPPTERIISIEDTAELRLDHPHWLPLEYRPPNIEGKGEITQRDLLRNALRMRPDRILIGEVRGAEAWELIKALNTGHEGGLSTIHANNAVEALHKLAHYLLETGVLVPYEALYARIASAIHVVVHVHRYQDGSRKVASITEVLDAAGSEIHTHDLVSFRPDPVGGGPVTGTFVTAPASVRLQALLEERGFSFSKELLA